MILCTIYDIELTDNYIYLGGDFDEIDGIDVYGLARIDRDTCQLDTDWLPRPNDTVFAIEAVGDSVFIGGAFDEVDGSYRSEFAKISASSGSPLDDDCVKQFYYDGDTETIYSIKADDNYLYVGGEFDEIYDPGLDATFSRNGLVRLVNDDNCTLDTSWNPNPTWDEEDPGTVRTINIDESDNSIYVGGHFTEIGGQTGSEFAKLDMDSGLADEAWNPEIWTEIWLTVYSSLITDNYLIVGGSFNHVGAEDRYSLAAFPYEMPPSPTPTPELTASVSSSDDDDDHETIQIPHAIKKLFGLIVAKPIKDSNTNGQEVLSIVFKDTLDFDAYLSANHAPVANLQAIRDQNPESTASGSANLNKGNILIAGWQGHQLVGFKQNQSVYWQVGQVQQLYYKAYPAPDKEAPIIIPEVQHKTSIIALKYNQSDLIPPGEPDTKFNELKLKLAHSMDGINWQIMSNSVADPINNTVAAIDKVGGYYVIVGSY